MPQWSVAEWRARIGGSWLAIGRPIKLKSSSSSGGTGCTRRVLTMNCVVTMMSLTLILIGVNLLLRALLVNRGDLRPITDLLEFGILSHWNLYWINPDYLLLTVSTLLSLQEFFPSIIIVYVGQFSLKQGLCLTSRLLCFLASLNNPLICSLLLLANFVMNAHSCLRAVSVLRMMLFASDQVAMLEPNSSVVKEELELRDRGELLRRLALSSAQLDIVLSVAVYVIIYQLLKSGDVEKNPGPGNLDYDSIDASTTLGSSNLPDVMEDVISIQSKFYALGRSLRLERRDLTAIRDAYPNEADSERALEDVLLLWLDQKYDAEKYGRPTWRMLVNAVDKESGGNDHELAKKIADQHPAEYQSRHRHAMETTEPTEKDLLGIDNAREVLDQLWEYRAKWRFIGMELGIKPSDLEAIAEDTRKVEDSLLEVIKSWLRCANPKPTRRVLTAITQSKLLVTHVVETKSVTQAQEDSSSTSHGLCCFRWMLVRRGTAATERGAETQLKAISTQEGAETQLEAISTQEDTEYAQYLKSLYKAKSLTSFSINEWPPPCTDKVFRLAMIKSNEIRRGHIGDDAVLREKTISGKVDDVLQRMVPVEIEDIFKFKDQQKEVKKVLMEGAPGSGKSTLSFYMCQQWMEGHLFQEYKLVIHVRLRESAIQNAKSLSELLPRRNKTMGIEVEDTITTSDGKDVLFVLDGWDELPCHVPSYSLILDLVNGKKLPATTVIITSRPTSSAILHRLVHLQIEILGFTKDELQQYFTKCLENNGEAVQRLLQRIKQNPIIEGSCYLPLNASILVHLFKCRDNVLPTTQYGIFTELVCTCIFRHLKKTGQDTVELRSLDELPSSTADQFRHLCKVAYDGVMQDMVIFDLGPNFNTLGLLQGVESFAVCGKSYSYNFLHLSIQELLCALHMVNELDEREQTEQFKKLFGQPRFMLVFQFFAAKTKLKTSGISEIVTQVTKKCCGHQPSHEDRTILISLMHCLFEAQDSSLCQLVASELNHKLTLGRSEPLYINIARYGIRLNPTDCYYLGYFLTFCDGFDVHLSGCSIGVDGCKSLFRSGEAYKFRLLDLSGNSIGREGAMAVAAAMKTATNLQELDLSGNSIGREGAMAVAAAMKTATNLQELDLTENSIGDEGAMAVAVAMKTATNLQVLGLSKNSISDKGAMAVAAAIETAANLQELALKLNTIGREAEDVIRAVAKKTGTKIHSTPSVDQYVNLPVINRSEVYVLEASSSEEDSDLDGCESDT